MATLPIWAQLLIAAIAAAGVALPGVLAFRAASRANRAAEKEKQRNIEIEGRKVDREAFTVARKIYQDAIDEVNRQLTRTREDLAIERHETKKLRARVAKLEKIITAAGLTVPDSGDTPPPGTIKPVT